MMWGPVLVADCEENKVTHRFKARNDVLEFIAVFKFG